ncbi:hypothetical protein AZE42_11652 [Rhizopogon vesiculosus]|uniref:Uncharacterized protein n=1 Tax=Rhizopogon vesiculosus TaxID=180088 RepID=A0A1J8PUF3_9AGAM|nr:hypothetical protein AZE42_11652 [Rhizopogon vesiculosus]
MSPISRAYLGLLLGSPASSARSKSTPFRV